MSGAQLRISAESAASPLTSHTFKPFNLTNVLVLHQPVTEKDLWGIQRENSATITYSATFGYMQMMISASGKKDQMF